MNTHEMVMYGGAFNPPHLDHTGIISKLLEQTAEKVIIIPTGRRDDKSYMDVSDKDRESMIRLATEEFGNRVVIDTTFLYGNMPTTTLNQAKYLENRYNKEIPQVFGSDVAPKMRWWDETGYVANQLPKVFIARPGYAIPPGIVDNYSELEYNSLWHSSTRVREEVAKILTSDRGSIGALTDMIHAKVCDFILQNRLFIPS